MKNIQEVEFNKESLVVEKKNSMTKNIVWSLSLALLIGLGIKGKEIIGDKEKPTIHSNVNENSYQGVDLNGWTLDKDELKTNKVIKWVSFYKEINNTTVTITRYLKNDKKYWGSVILYAKNPEKNIEVKNKKIKEKESDEVVNKGDRIKFFMFFEKFMWGKVRENSISVYRGNSTVEYSKFGEVFYVGVGDEKMKKYEDVNYDMFADKLENMNIYVNGINFMISNPGINKKNLDEIFNKIAVRNEDYKEFAKNYKFELIYQQ